MISTLTVKSWEPCISGMNACSKIHDYDHLDRFSAIHEWATNAHAKLALEACTADDPALG